MDSHAADPQPAPEEPGRPLLDAPERAPLRARIRAAVAARRPWPVAVRTLELLAEAGAEPAAGEPGYRVVDRHGAPRLRPDAAGGALPLTLDDLLDEIQARHPALFRPPEAPEPVPAAAAPQEAPEAPRDSAFAAGASEVRAATARFVGSQSERVRALAERSTTEGRALAQSAAGRFAGLRARLRPAPTPAPATGTPPTALAAAPDAIPVAAQAAPSAALAAPPAAAPAFAPSPEPDAAQSWNARIGRRVEALRDRLADLRPSGLGDGDPRTRRWLTGGAVGALAMVAVAALVVAGRDPGEERATRGTGAGTAQAPSTQAPAVQAPSTQAPARPAPRIDPEPAPDAPPEDEGRTAQATEPAEPLPANAVTGTAQVIDTATLRIGGKLVRLFGVEWVRGGQAEELAKYIAARPVTCQPVPGSEGQLCRINGRDLSEVVLFNGGGRASSEATPELVAAEDHARTERLGVWRR